MKDIPIIFSAPMVLALLDGRKTMTRRLALSEAGPKVIKGRQMTGYSRTSPWQRVKPGDRLWVRESLTRSGGYIQYAADHQMIQFERGAPPSRLWPRNWKQDPRPSIHMPRDCSRLTLTVSEVKTERLDVISEADAKAEGAIFHDGHGVGHSGWRHDPDHGYVHRTAVASFACLWDRLHGEGSFNACQEVVALTFTVHKTNIDAMQAEAA